MHRFQCTFQLQKFFSNHHCHLLTRSAGQRLRDSLRQQKMQVKCLVQVTKSPKPHSMGPLSSVPHHRHLLSSTEVPTDISEWDPAMGARPLEALSCNKARYRSQHLSQEMLWSWVLLAPYGKQGYRNSLTLPGIQSFLWKLCSPRKIAALLCFNILTLSSRLPRGSFKHTFSTANYGIKQILTIVIPVSRKGHTDKKWAWTNQNLPKSKQNLPH